MIRFENLGYKYTADEIIEYYSAPPVNEYFVSFCENLIEELRQIGKIRTTETYTTTLNSFKRFMNFRKKGRDIPFDNIDSNLMMEYEQYLKSNDICPNSTSYYMRNLRAMYNRAVEKELVIQRYPFKHVYTGIDKTVKRAVPAKIIRQIRDMDLSHDSSLEYARDLFMFSFYTRGMSFIDMAYLKKSNLQNGFLSYRRKKTNQQLVIKWEKPMQEIIDKYDTIGSSYLLPIILDAKTDERKQYKNAAQLVNSKLKKLGKQIGLPIPLTSYVARHAWASIASKRRVNEILSRMNISHRAEHFPQQLSGGQQQRVAIARAVVSNPKLILADEPTGNLDSKNGREVMELLSELNREGTTVIMVTHSQHDSTYAHRVLHLFDGELVKGLANKL